MSDLEQGEIIQLQPLGNMKDGILDVIEFIEGPVPIISIEVSPKSIDRKPDAIRLTLES